MTDNDVLGWQNTRWGMTENEILLAMPSTLVKTSPADFNKLYSTLGIDVVMIGDHTFNVKLQMSKKTDRLEQVLISCVDDPARPNKNIMLDATRILSERFGTPKRSGTSSNMMWKFPTTTITISQLYIEDVIYQVSIMFNETQNIYDLPAAF